jgi:hypothetical protein
LIFSFDPTSIFNLQARRLMQMKRIKEEQVLIEKAKKELDLRFTLARRISEKSLLLAGKQV